MSVVIALLVHAGIGLAVVLSIAANAGKRAEEVAVARAEAQRARADLDALRQQVDRDRALRDGLRTRDAYAVELLARERLGATRVGEIAVPPRPVDSPRTKR